MVKAKSAAVKVLPMRKKKERPDVEDLIDAFDAKIQRMDQDLLNEYVGAYITIEINDTDSACIDAGWLDEVEDDD